jgi:hypothetical protein
MMKNVFSFASGVGFSAFILAGDDWSAERLAVTFIFSAVCLVVVALGSFEGE